MPYLLDTNHCIYLLNAASKPAHRRTLQEENTRNAVLALPEPFHISRITIAELYYGAFKSQRVKENLEALREFKRSVRIIPITEGLLSLFGEIKAETRTRGDIVENFDLLIGTTAILHGLTLVTNDKAFDMLKPTLKLENWSVPPTP